MRETEITIQKLGPKGDGIHLNSRGSIYVDRALPGDHIKAFLKKDDNGMLRGNIATLITPSVFRQKAPCPHYESCGNCTLQHVSRDFYRKWKIQMVDEAFQRKGLRPKQWLPPVFFEGANRRRATFSALKQRNKIILGYYGRRTDRIADIDSCLVLHPQLMELREKIKSQLGGILIENEPVDIFLQKVNDQTDLLITGELIAKGLTSLKNITEISRLSWRSHEKEKITTLWKKNEVTAHFGALSVALPPAAFLQPTPQGESALVEAVLAALPAKGNFADLFSGCGSFTGPMLERGTVDAYEVVPSSVQALTKAAKDLPLKVFRQDLFTHPLRREELNRYSAVVFDPPRGGCPEQAEKMASARTPLLIGVSCNPATFARDARILCDGGYWLQSLQVVDQFFWSHHVEVVGVFTKQKMRRGRK